MATYAIGDIQGCYDDLIKLLEQIKFNETDDSLWFVGDLVNRGPQSLETLRFVKSLGHSAITVLGNHDLHLLAMFFGSGKKSDTLEPILKAVDRDELLHWLRHRPLMHYDEKLNFNMLHAGLPPQWTIEQARDLATEVEEVLQGKDHADYFADMYGDKPRLWTEELTGMKRWRYITNCLTRLRFCSTSGKLVLSEKGPPSESDYIPWFKHPERKSKEARIVFGHWSTLGLLQTDNIWSIDTGCLWGGSMTAIELDHPDGIKVHSYQCESKQDPHQFI